MTPHSVMLTGGTVHPAPHQEHADLLTEGSTIRALGPVGSTPVGPRTEVIDARDATVVPLLVESAVAALPPDRRDAWALRPGRPAIFAVVRGEVSEDRVQRMLVVHPPDLVAVVVAGAVEVRDGEALRPPGAATEAPVAWTGTWTDDRRDMKQHLLPGGRYSETRQRRTGAWTGRYWVREDRITYLDDTGFWAFGQLLAGVLHHAGFVLVGPT